MDRFGHDGMTLLDIAVAQDADGARELTAWPLTRAAHPVADLIG
ncbi:hypothetical protein [Streptomyces sp. G-G2]|nr:hypothetical protein [Streptomyces sp. G-G2]MDJ0379934.1 hypothetical protein [Streptomyces sp. G-G2]